MVSTIMLGQGLDGVVLEKFYITNANDNTESMNAGAGTLTDGSTCYRIYIDMAAGYELVTVYGENTPAANKIDPLEISSTASFYNHEDRGETFGYTISDSRFDDNVVMLDSWFSTGRIGSNSGVLKADDTDGSILSGSSAYQNVDPAFGIDPKTQDGINATASSVTWSPSPGTEALIGAQFGNSNTNTGSLVFTDNAVGVTTSLTGPTADNRVLIAQVTTAGELSYKLNVVLREVATGNSEEWVAETPQAGQFTHSTLTLVPNAAPTVMITAPTGGTAFTAGQTISVAANAADTDGTIAGVEFSYNGMTVNDTDGTDGYTADFVATNGVSAITATATDNIGDTASETVNVIVGANPGPVVALGTLPAPSFTDSMVLITATATDADGISSVEFFANGASIGLGVLNGGVYELNWNTAGLNKGDYIITAVATDALNASTTSAPATLTLLNNGGNIYEVREVTAVCNEENICVPIAAQQEVSNIIGFDIELEYPTNKVIPTGIIRKGTLAPVNLVETSYSIPSPGKMLIAVNFNTTAPLSSRFMGIGDVVCVEFEKTALFMADDSVEFVVTSLQESYITGVINEPVDTNSYITFKDTLFDSNLKFWGDNSPIGYKAGTNLETRIFGSSSTSCTALSTDFSNPDSLGNFVHNLNNGLFLNIERDIDNTTDVQSVVNGFDALLVRKVLIEDPSYIPTIYEILSMDVNQDGVISAGDASQINQRAVLILGEFQQRWNYDNNGVSNGEPSKDWIFVEETIPFIFPEYSISSNFPRYDGVGFNKDNVPSPDYCNATPVSNWNRCAVIGDAEYVGYLLGDVNGNYKNIADDVLLRSDDKVIIDLSAATYENGVTEIPVSFTANTDVNSIDFALDFDGQVSVASNNPSMQVLANVNDFDQVLRVTSNSTNQLVANLPAFSMFVEGKVTADDIRSIAGYLNGDKVNVEVRDGQSSTLTDEVLTNVFPNPVTGVLNIESSQDANVEILNLNGQSTSIAKNIKANSRIALDVTSLTNGIYIVKISNDDFVSTERVVVTK